MIKITDKNTAKRVNKPWGHELWLECDNNSVYVVKLLHIKAGSQLSLQAHCKKIETMYVMEGIGRIRAS